MFFIFSIYKCFFKFQLILLFYIIGNGYFFILVENYIIINDIIDFLILIFFINLIFQESSELFIICGFFDIIISGDFLSFLNLFFVDLIIGIYYVI